MPKATLKRNIFQRILGLCATRPPADGGCWTLESGKIVVDLARAPELAEANGAVRLEGKNLPERVLLTRGEDGAYRAFKNRCTHMGRRLDPVPGAGQVQCCSVNKSTFENDGKCVSGPGKKELATYPVTVEGGKLEITL